jgi:hypothetical protein
MAHLWTQDDSGWIVRTLSRKSYDLIALAAARATPPAGLHGETCGETAKLVRTDYAGSEVWALMSAPGAGVRVRCEELLSGLRVLCDRDEIRTRDGKQYFFSTEALAAVAPFENSEREVFCGRCRQRIEAGAPAVRCPGCGIYYDQSAELPCWTYADSCAICGRSTALNLGFAWSPEDGLE